MVVPVVSARANPCAAGCQRSPTLCGSQDAQLIALVAAGLVNTAIAHRMLLSPSTVRHYLMRLYATLDVGNKAELVARAVALGIISVNPWPPTPQLCACAIERIERPRCVLRIPSQRQGDLGTPVAGRTAYLADRRPCPWTRVGRL